MRIDEFNKAVKEQLLTCENLLLNKGHEYAPDAIETNEVDRLAHFKKAAAITGTTQKAALFGMLAKHIVSVSDMCTDGKKYTVEIINPVEYASYVEFGHRTPSGGWVEGQYMLTIENMKLNLCIDMDTAGNYSYSSSIDRQTYNQIKITFENKKSGKREVFIAKDSANINKWGLLQYTDKVEIATNGAAKAEALLKLYNTKTRSLSISDALGDIRVRAGSSVIVKLGLGDINIQSYLLVEKVTHKFKQNQHLMDLKLRGGTFVA